MERLRRLVSFWGYLPAFRAVAESEHLPTAARAIGSSPPGLSRAIRLLEHDLGQTLFERGSRRLQLNASGLQLLDKVRDAMRLVDDGLQELEQQTFKGRLRVAASNSTSQVYLLPALQNLASEHPQIVPEIVNLDAKSACAGLRDGTVDLALVEDTEVGEALAVERLVEITYGIYCGTTHPLCRKKNLQLSRCLEFPFVAASSGVDDGWPATHHRQIGLRVSALNLAMQACASGRFLALLPDDAAGRQSKRLCRLPVGTLNQTTLWAAYRRPLRPGADRVTVLRDQLREVVKEAAAVTAGR